MMVLKRELAIAGKAIVIAMIGGVLLVAFLAPSIAVMHALQGRCW